MKIQLVISIGLESLSMIKYFETELEEEKQKTKNEEEEHKITRQQVKIINYFYTCVCVLHPGKLLMMHNINIQKWCVHIAAADIVAKHKNYFSKNIARDDEKRCRKFKTQRTKIGRTK